MSKLYDYLRAHIYIIIYIILLVPLLVPQQTVYSKIDNNENAGKTHKIVIAGSGPAGLGAAIYAARSKLDPLVIEGEEGGQLAKAGLIENWPGLKPISGAELANDLRRQAEGFSTRFKTGYIEKVDFTQKPFVLYLNTKEKILADSVIITTGAKPKKLNKPGEEKYLGKGVAICAKCDGPLAENKPAVVIGGKYSALREIETLTKYASEITILNRDHDITGPLPLIISTKENPKVKIMNNCEALEIMGDQTGATGIRYADQNKEEKIMPIKNIFVLTGLNPSSDIFADQVTLNSKKRICVQNTTHTSVPGVFAAGDVTDKTYHQAPTASSQGYEAAMDAEKYLREQKLL